MAAEDSYERFKVEPEKKRLCPGNSRLLRICIPYFQEVYDDYRREKMV